MAEPWHDGEEGPDCACGSPAVVKLLPDGTPVLICLFHSGEAGIVTRLPDQRPADWYARLRGGTGG